MLSCDLVLKFRREGSEVVVVVVQRWYRAPGSAQCRGAVVVHRWCGVVKVQVHRWCRGSPQVVQRWCRGA